MAQITSALLTAARDGDREAFELIVRTHFRLAFATARAIVSDQTSAEDVVQDAFVRCWQRLPQCRGPDAFAGWLRSIVRSVALNHVEREAIRTTRPLDAVRAVSASSPEADLDRSLLADRLSSALETLPPTQREILLLHDLEGFRHPEISRLVGVSEFMSRKHLSHARARMRQALSESSRGRAAR